MAAKIDLLSGLDLVPLEEEGTLYDLVLDVVVLGSRECLRRNFQVSRCENGIVQVERCMLGSSGFAEIVGLTDLGDMKLQMRVLEHQIVD